MLNDNNDDYEPKEQINNDNDNHDLSFYAEGHDKKFDTYYEVYQFSNVHGEIGKLCIPSKEIAGSDGALFSKLAGAGYRVPKIMATKKALLTTLEKQRSSNTRCLDVAEQIGWLFDGYQHFVMPHKIYGQGGYEVLFCGKFNSSQQYGCSGTLADWQNGIAARCRGNSNMMFSIGTSLASPLLHIMHIDSGGFQLVGPSRIGKTTCQHVGRSVFGIGLDTWNSTLQAIGKKAANFNDSTLFIDETGQADDKGNVLKSIYNLAGGQGRDRITDDNAKYKWRILFFSSSEQTIDEIANGIKGSIMDGQRARMVDIRAETSSGMGAIEKIHGLASSKAFVDAINEARKKYYGTAGDLYMEQLVAWAVKDIDGLRKWLKKRIAAYMKRAEVDLNEGLQSNIAERFALVYAAGRLAYKFGIIPWKKDEMFEAVHSCHQRILLPQTLLKRHSANNSALDQDQDYTQHVRNYIESKKKLFTKVQDGMRLTSTELDNAIGIRYKNQRGKTEYLFTSECFKKRVCGSYPSEKVLKSLESSSLLIDRSAQRLLLKGKGPTRVIAIKGRILK